MFFISLISIKPCTQAWSNESGTLQSLVYFTPITGTPKPRATLKVLQYLPIGAPDELP